MIMSGYRLPLIEVCLRALADCKEASAMTTLISPHRERMTRDEVSAHTKHDLARRLAVLLVDDAEIAEAIVWSDRPIPESGETDTEFTARTVVMKASTYFALCQALNDLRLEALEDKFRVKP